MPTDALHALDALLLDCLRVDGRPIDRQAFAALDPPAWSQFLSRASGQRVRPVVRQRLLALGGPALVPAPQWADLKASCLRIALLNMRLHADLKVLADAFAAAQIPVVALKGAHVATALYGDVALREMSDIDLLVPEACLERAAALTMAAGYAPMKPFTLADDVAAARHLTTFLKDGVRVEIHWTISDPRQRSRIDAAPLVERSQPFAVAGARLRALAPEDLVVHLCCHVSYSHRFEFGLRSLCDVALLVRQSGAGIDWQAVVRRAEQWGWARGVHLVLELARDLLGAPVPPAVLASFPAPLDDRIRAAARAQLLVGYPELRAIAVGVSSLAERRGLAARARYIGSRVFLGRDDLQRALDVPKETRPSIWRLYTRRAARLLKRDTFTVLRLLTGGDSELRARAARRHRLVAWLGVDIE